MPNNVSNKIEFSCDNEQAEKILAEIRGPEREVDFNSLIPMPIHIYRGGISATDESDFQEHNCWFDWSRANWGTKWNAYAARVENKNGTVEICFDTAWKVPYPFIVAFAQKYRLEFTHKYFDEGGDFWGIDTWKNGVRSCRNRAQELYRPLSIELKLYDPEDPEN